MNNAALQQLRRETESWKRLLAFLQAENVILKIRIAEIVSQSSNPYPLKEAESFNDRFLLKDELIFLLKKDILAFEGMLAISGADGLYREKIRQREKELQGVIGALELQFKKMITEFNRYVIE